MIELRWTWQHRGYIEKERILQYRFRAPLHTTSVQEYPPEAWQWSEWKEVPEVDISPAAKEKS